jgi:hypothetical protein
MNALRDDPGGPLHVSLIGGHCICLDPGVTAVGPNCLRRLCEKLLAAGFEHDTILLVDDDEPRRTTIGHVLANQFEESTL